MKRHELARLFVKKAVEDIVLVDTVIEVESISDEIIGFHCQQAAEKLMKAVLTAAGETVRKTHDLETLVAALLRIGEQEAARFGSMDSLTPFATVFRYEGLGDMGFDRYEAREMLRKIQIWCEARLDDLEPK